ncbi:MAG: hypothetical protein R2685_15870 [Candidatus Nitrosocosmicus sp.]|nr:hypothetical protein [Candidatus Nitrosocosmicus sp.]
MTLTRSSFEKIYRSEQDVKVKERMQLILDVVYGDRVSSHVAKDLHRNRSWASVWLKKYDEEGIDGSRDRPKSGRHTELSSEIEYRLRPS